MVTRSCCNCTLPNRRSTHLMLCLTKAAVCNCRPRSVSVRRPPTSRPWTTLTKALSRALCMDGQAALSHLCNNPIPGMLPPRSQWNVSQRPLEQEAVCLLIPYLLVPPFFFAKIRGEPSAWAVTRRGQTVSSHVSSALQRGRGRVQRLC